MILEMSLQEYALCGIYYEFNFHVPTDEIVLGGCLTVVHVSKSQYIALVY